MATYLTAEKFSFKSRALAEDAFGVVDFSGGEGLSRCYEFEVTLISNQGDLDLEEILEKPAVFTIHRKGGDDVPFHGILASFEQRHEYGQFVFYRAVLVPRLWWLNLTFHNQVFLNMTVPQVLEAVLKDGGLNSLDFELRLQKDYPAWEYICQYRESHFHFVSRWMEREGIYYYFEQTDQGEKLILTDTNLAHSDMPQGSSMTYAQPSGLDLDHWDEVVHSFVCKQQMLPQKVLLKDYNYMTPDLEISGKALVKEKGRGEIYIYGEHFRTPQEGDDLAEIRAQEYRAREKAFTGESLVPFIRPGYTFTLKEHYRPSYNGRYLTTEIHHEGNQAAYLIAGLQGAVSSREHKAFYRNAFSAMPAGVQYRPARKTEKARFFGTMNARIDAAASGKYAELDEHGRYKVILPFDMSGRKNAKASTWLRMMQPYGGTGHGMHFPLHKGTEVLLTFIDGDPDRPIIAGSVPNPESPSLVQAENQTQCRITSGGQNKIHIEDKEGSERILLSSPTAGTWLRLGAPNDPPPAEAATDMDGVNLYTSSALKVQAGTKNSIILGESSSTVGGSNNAIVVVNDNKAVLGIRTDTTIGARFDLKMGWGFEFTPLYKQVHGGSLKVKGEVTKMVGEVTKMVGENTKMIGENTKLIGNNTAMIGEVVEMVGDDTEFGAELNRMLAEELKMSGQVTAMAGESTKMAGSKTVMAGEEIKMAGSKTAMAGEALEMAGDQTRMAGEMTAMAGENMEMAGLKVIL